MQEEIRVVAAIADTDKVVFYLENGDTKTLKQTDPRLEKVLAAIVGPNSRGEVAIVNLETMAVYKEYEEKSKGFVKFFKAAKSAVAGIFGQEIEPKTREELLAPQPVIMPTVAPKAPVPAAQATETVIENHPEPKPINNLSKVQNSLKPMTDDEIGPGETIVGVFGNTAIPEMEKLKPYIDHALKHSSHEALENFFKRILPHIGKRGHSIQDLFRFMEKADMPIADDGTLIGYKLLNKTNEEGIFVDIHTGNVKQKVGSYVCVREELVDRNRSNECSNGLHIARRGYIGGFGSSSSQLTLIKLAPEDVVTVPHGDPSKVRAMGYHIVGLVNNDGHILARKNEPMTKDNETANFIANVIKGNHIGRIQEVRIGGQRGSNITYTDLVSTAPEVVTDETLTAEAFDHNGKPEEQGLAEPVNLKELNKQITIESAKPVEEINNPPTEEGEKIIEQALVEAPVQTENAAQRAARIKREKRAAKKVVEQPKQEIKATPAKSQPTSSKKPSKAPTAKPVATKKEPMETKVNNKLKATANALTSKVTPSKAKPKATAKPEPKKETPKPSQVEPKKPMTAAEQARDMFNTWITDTNQTNLDVLLNFKKSKKKSWEALGFNEKEIKKITN